MKALTLKQPFATLICLGIKDVENRSWQTAYRGKLLIHSSTKPYGNLKDSLLIEKYDHIDFEYEKLDSIEFINSAIVGEVELIDIVTDSTSPWAQQGKYHWLLKDPLLYEHPILNVKGHLNLWKFNM
ncbi:ASCH domain-containing protein [Sphingobacterium hungaricum]|uniref:ASCH domain-containing protein n=1 Tax=Sphingobacterium hungaricum TaxID=2082723 RepID=A0A928UWW6_9SPHI|nr:ASCH domain-containing protein [Sphingobacterium hungaricum]MBE8714488.1 hypothetical protein [Sphingobacterium hungaricum]